MVTKFGRESRLDDITLKTQVLYQMIILRRVFKKRGYSSGFWILPFIAETHVESQLTM
jgi:hypothetical protein